MSLLKDILFNFKFVRVLSHDTKAKLIFLLGTVEEQDCILSFEKTQYEESVMRALPQLINQTRLDDLVENSIYGWCTAALSEPLVDTRIKYIYPATDVHIAKYETQSRVMLIETPEQYKNITLPYIQSIPPSRIEWVHNILHRSAEQERVLYHYHDPESGFVILPDMKWDGSVESLYWIAITMQPILSIRELNSSHLPLLKNLRAEIYESVESHTGMKPEQLRLFVHYQPSYYHFHVHITALTFSDAPGVVSGQAHLLDTVINNIELYPDYYQKVSLPFVIGDKHKLNQLWDRLIPGKSDLDKSFVFGSDVEEESTLE